MDDSLHPDALAAAARTRALGMHFWGHSHGIALVGADGDVARMRIPGPASVPALSTLADVAIGWAVHLRLEVPGRLATATLSLQLAAPPTGAVEATTQVQWMDTDRGHALVQARLTDETGALVATGQSWFLAMPIPDGVRRSQMPWERETAEIAPLAPADLDEAEREAVLTATAALERAAAEGTHFGDELLGLVVEQPDADHVVATATIGPHLGNRIGNVQGGAQWGAAAFAATRLASPHMRLAEGTLHYLRPGKGERLTVRVEALRRGRSTEFFRIDAETDGTVISTGEFTFLTDDSGDVDSAR